MTRAAARAFRGLSKAGRLRAVARLVVGLALLVSAQGVAAAPQQKKVLVLDATRRDAQVAIVGDRVMPRILDEGLAGGVDYYSEYLDESRFRDPVYRSAFRDYLRLKYQGQRFDLIIAVMDSAVEFIAAVRQELFAGTPLVFWAASPGVVRPENSAGIVGEVDFADTIALATQLQPDVERVFVVSGADVADRMYEKQARARLRSVESRLAVTYLSGLPTKELMARLADLPRHSVVLFLLVSRDGAGEAFHPLAYLDRVTAVANAPTYCWVDSAMGHGIVGGSMRTQASEAEAAAELALRVLGGEPADRIPLLSSDMGVRQVDWRQLGRWGIREARVPAGTLVRSREPGAWERYKLYIISAVALLLAQSALIAGLMLQRERRRQAETKLRASQVELSTAYARLLGAEERERARIARELHDDIGQRVAALTMELDYLAEGPPLAATEWYPRIRALADRSLELSKDVRFTSRNLHNSGVDHLGLESAAAAFCWEVSPKLRVDFSASDIPDDVPGEVALCVFRVLQEAVSNVARHARARRVTVTLRGGAGEIQLEIVDDGIGFDTGAASGSGMGLVSMRERLDIVDGELDVESRPGHGTAIRARVPLDRAGGASRVSGAAVA